MDREIRHIMLMSARHLEEKKHAKRFWLSSVKSSVQTTWNTHINHLNNTTTKFKSWKLQSISSTPNCIVKNMKRDFSQLSTVRVKKQQQKTKKPCLVPNIFF